MKYNIAILGATGVVGRKTLQILAELKLENNNFYLFATKKSAGKKLKIGKTKYIVQELTKENLCKNKFDFALLCVGENVSKLYAKYLTKRGSIVIDFSSAFRANYPLIVPEINFNDIGESKLICNPNCSTAQCVLALNLINQKFGISNVVYSSYQAVSGAGKKAIDDLHTTQQSKLKKFDYPISNNLICYIGSFDKYGYCTEENKMIFETKKILHSPKMQVIANCVRVPIKNCHLVSTTFTTCKNSKLTEIQNLLKQTVGVIYDNSLLPMPLNANNKNDVIVGRLKAHKNIKNCYSMFVCADNLRKGASLNAVQILKKLIEVKK